MKQLMRQIHSGQSVGLARYIAELEVAIARANRPNTKENNLLPTVSRWTYAEIQRIHGPHELHEQCKALLDRIYSD